MVISVRLYPPFIFRSYRPIFKIIFCLKGMTDLTFILFFRLSVRSVPLLIFCAYRPIFKIIFLFERYDIRDLTFIIFVRLSVPYPPFNFRSNHQISKILFLFERYNVRDLSLYFLSVFPYPLSPSVLTITFSTAKKNQESRLFQLFQNLLFIL